jgi:hypothetical protein
MCYFNIRQYLTKLHKSEFFPKTLFLSKYFNKIYIQQNLNNNRVIFAFLSIITIKKTESLSEY